MRKSISNILKRNFQEELDLKSILERVNNCPMSSCKWDSCYHSFQGLGDIMEDRKEYAQHCLWPQCAHYSRAKTAAVVTDLWLAQDLDKMEHANFQPRERAAHAVAGTNS